MRIVAAIGSLLVVLLVPVLLIRFRKRWVAGFNLAVTNRITSRFAGRLPGFGILTHVGRKSGHVYRTPVNVFAVSDVHGTTSGFVIALTYGPDCEWVKNVQAAGRCQIKTRGVVYELAEPTIIHDPTRRRFPPVVRLALFVIGADDFMQLSRKQ
jgi:deazaflavin-dependent oxidoreductase (nitroreductase family)